PSDSTQDRPSCPTRRSSDLDRIKDRLADDLQVDGEQINAELVGPSWGEQIADKAWQGLGIFLFLVVIYLAIAFEWRMAVAAFVEIGRAQSELQSRENLVCRL